MTYPFYPRVLQSLIKRQLLRRNSREKKNAAIIDETKCSRRVLSPKPGKRNWPSKSLLSTHTRIFHDIESEGFQLLTRWESALARAWIRVSEEPVVDVEQKEGIFYFKKWNCYNNLKPESSPLRLLAYENAIIKQIAKFCVKFSAFSSALVSGKLIGVKDEAIIRI